MGQKAEADLSEKDSARPFSRNDDDLSAYIAGTMGFANDILTCGPDQGLLAFGNRSFEQYSFPTPSQAQQLAQSPDQAWLPTDTESAFTSAYTGFWEPPSVFGHQSPGTQGNLSWNLGLPSGHDYNMYDLPSQFAGNVDSESHTQSQHPQNGLSFH